MTLRMTVTLPADVTWAVEEVSQHEGVSSEEIVVLAVKQHVFLRRFQSQRKRLSAKAAEHEIITDEDVFDDVS